MSLYLPSPTQSPIRGPQEFHIGLLFPLTLDLPCPARMYLAYMPLFLRCLDEKIVYLCVDLVFWLFSN